MSDAADDFVLSPRLPDRTARRASFRIFLVTATTTLVTLGIAFGSFFGVSTLVGDSPASDPPVSTGPSPSEAEPSPSETERTSCDQSDSSLPQSYRASGSTLKGDVDGDGDRDEVYLASDQARPERCRNVLVVDSMNGRRAAAAIPPVDWPTTGPELLLLAEIDGAEGVEPVIVLSEVGFEPGYVFTMSSGSLERMRLGGGRHEDYFPFYDEFPAGTDCATEPGHIVITTSRISKLGDTHYDVTRSFYRASGSRFELESQDEHTVEVARGEAERLWPEVRGQPFRSCSTLVIS